MILYSTHCPKCIVLEKKLNSKNINYEMITDENLMIEKGFMSAPILEVDDKTLDFKAAIDWVGEQ